MRGGSAVWGLCAGESGHIRWEAGLWERVDASCGFWMEFGGERM
jgi:hypothetical protein